MICPDLDWCLFFVTRHCETVCAATRQLVTSLDFRGFASGRTAWLDYQALSRTIRLFSRQFPAVRCILLDGLVDYDPAEFLRPQNVADFCPDGSLPMPLILSLDHCNLPLPNNFFMSAYWRQLVYLDMSDIPGSLQGLINNTSFQPSVLPNLRILKIRGREINGASLSSALSGFRECLCSLDLTRNNLADDVVRLLATCFFCRPAVQTEAYFETEGKLAVIRDEEGKAVRSDWFGSFTYIAESSWSCAFSHPERHLADSPAYDPNSHWRLGGRESLRSDHVDDVKAILAGGVGEPIPDWHDVQAIEYRRTPCVLTHLHLSGNKDLTVKGLGQLFRQAKGHLRHFDCASLSISTPLKSRAGLSGVLGCSHLFRPVIASNLQSLRIHHSLVTQVPTVTDPSMSAVECIWFAETSFRERAEIAFPLAFMPDMNPRLQSLTLTCLPRVSAGPLITRLVRFLLLAYEQEQAIQSAVFSKSHRSPSILRGLRHIRLEFEAVPTGDDRITGLDELDTGALLRPSTDEFSFFGEGAWASEQDELKPYDGFRSHLASSGRQPSVKIELDETAPQTGQAVRLAHYPLPGMMDVNGVHEYICSTVRWEDKTTRVSVWVGTGTLGAHHATNAYMSNLANPSLRTDIGPATPDQMAAGVPPGSCVYNAAWDAILFTEPRRNPPRALPDGMRDVVQAIRQFRIGTRAAYAAHRRASRAVEGEHAEAELALRHEHWTGRLEILLGG